MAFLICVAISVLAILVMYAWVSIRKYRCRTMLLSLDYEGLNEADREILGLFWERVSKSWPTRLDMALIELWTVELELEAGLQRAALDDQEDPELVRALAATQASVLSHFLPTMRDLRDGEQEPREVDWPKVRRELAARADASDPEVSSSALGDLLQRAAEFREVLRQYLQRQRTLDKLAR